MVLQVKQLVRTLSTRIYKDRKLAKIALLATSALGQVERFADLTLTRIVISAQMQFDLDRHVERESSQLSSERRVLRIVFHVPLAITVLIQQHLIS